MKKRMQKIMFFIGNMSESGGTERVLSLIADGLSDRGFDVFIVSLWGGGDTFFPMERDIRIYWAEKERATPGITGTLCYLIRILERERPDFLVDVDMILGCYSIFLKWRTPGMRWISWEHFNYYYHFRRNSFLRRIIRRLVVRHADVLVVLTDEDKGYYQKNLNLKCRIIRIYDPVPYQTAAYEKEEKPFVFAAGRLTRAKGFDLLIQSWKKLERRYPEWSVVVAGKGEERDRLKRAVRKAGIRRLEFIGNVQDIEAYYEKAAFFVLPSRDEGFGMVLAEAMRFALPTVAYNCMAGPGEIIEDGETGFLVEPGNTNAFADRMEMLIKDQGLRKRMGDRAKDSVRRFDKEGILDVWEKLFESF